MKIRYFLVALVLVLAACSGGGTDTGSGGDETAAADLPNPCELVPQSALDAIFPSGVPDAEPGEVTGPGGTSGGKSCSWGLGLGGLRVSVFLSSSFLTPRSICDYCEDVADLGDEAWGGRSEQGMGGALIAVVLGDMGVQISGDGLEATVEDLVPVAISVVQGLP